MHNSLASRFRSVENDKTLWMNYTIGIYHAYNRMASMNATNQCEAYNLRKKTLFNWCNSKVLWSIVDLLNVCDSRFLKNVSISTG